MDISIVLNKCFSAGEIHWQQCDSEYVSQNKKADVTYKNFCALRDEAVEYFYGIESRLLTAESNVYELEIESVNAKNYMVEISNFANEQTRRLIAAESKLAELESAKPKESVDPVFYYRPTSSGGYEGPIHANVIEKVRIDSGAWKPLYTEQVTANKAEVPIVGTLRIGKHEHGPFDFDPSIYCIDKMKTGTYKLVLSDNNDNTK